MNRYQQQLCENLTVLLSEDYELLNDIIIEYVTMLGDTNKMHDLHDYTCKELENDWGRGEYLSDTQFLLLSSCNHHQLFTR